MHGVCCACAAGGAAGSLANRCDEIDAHSLTPSSVSDEERWQLLFRSSCQGEKGRLHFCGARHAVLLGQGCPWSACSGSKQS